MKLLKWLRILLIFICFLTLTFYYGRQELKDVYATNPTADVTVTYQMEVTWIVEPTGLTLTDLGCITVTANWTKGVNSTYTMVRVSRSEYPEDPGEGELAYYGDAETCNITGLNLDAMTLYVTAFAYDTDNVTYAAEYATADIGGEGMTEIADSIDSLVETLTTGITGDGSYLAFFIVAFLLALIFWKGGVVLKSIGVSVALVYGLTVAASCDIYSAMWVAGVGIALIGIGILYELVISAMRRRRQNDH